MAHTMVFVTSFVRRHFVLMREPVVSAACMESEDEVFLHHLTRRQPRLYDRKNDTKFARSYYVQVHVHYHGHRLVYCLVYTEVNKEMAFGISRCGNRCQQSASAATIILPGQLWLRKTCI